jgi:hypothetical protein
VSFLESQYLAQKSTGNYYPSFGFNAIASPTRDNVLRPSDLTLLKSPSNNQWRSTATPTNFEHELSPTNFLVKSDVWSELADESENRQ